MSSPPPPTEGRRWIDVRPGEFAVVAGAALYFFVLLTVNYLLRAVRDAAGIDGGPEDLPELYTGTLLATLVISPIFAWLVAHTARRRFIRIAYRVFALTLVAFYVWMSAVEPTDPTAGHAFFIWFSACNLLIISVFWGFLADIFANSQAKRLYGLIGAAGTIGAIAGSKFTSWLMKLENHPEPVTLLLIGAVLMEVCVQVMAWTGRRAPERAPNAAVREPERPDALTGFRLVAQRPYLRMLCLYMVLQTICATFLYQTQQNMAYAHFPDRAARTAFSADLSFWTNSLSLFLQVFVTSKLFKHAGVTLMLLPLPIIAIFGFGTLGFAESILALQLAVVLSKACEYSTGKPARESLYTVVSRAEKYQAKSFIDTFVYRGGDLSGAWIFDGLKSAAQLSLGTIAHLAVPLAAIWAGVAYALGRRQEALAASVEKAEAAIAKEVPGSRAGLESSKGPG